MELVITAHQYRERELLAELKGLGSFSRTDFRDVIRGEVEDLETFLRSIEDGNVSSLSRIVPVERSFHFSFDNVVGEFIDAVKPFIDGMEKGESFSVKVVRRGLKGAFSSQQVAKDVGTFISEVVGKRDGTAPRVDLENPDKAVIFETLGRWCGVGVIPRRMRKEYLYLKLP